MVFLRSFLGAREGGWWGREARLRGHHRRQECRRSVGWATLLSPLLNESLPTKTSFGPDGKKQLSFPTNDLQKLFLRSKALAKAARAVVGNAFALGIVGVFDVYQGKGLPEGTKSLAFSLVFRAADRTLTDDEVNAVFTKTQQSIVADGKTAVRT